MSREEELKQQLLTLYKVDMNTFMEWWLLRVEKVSAHLAWAEMEEIKKQRREKGLK